MSAPLQGTASAALAIDRVKYTHDGMIDLMIAKPGVSQNELAKHFGYTAPWVSRVVNSDAFLARLAERKGDLVDPSIILSFDEKLRALADASVDIVMEKMLVTKNPDTAFKALELSTKALGYGARAANVSVQQNFVVAMPEKAASAMDWAAKHAGGGMSAGPAMAIVGEVTEIPEKVEEMSPALAAMIRGTDV